MRFVPKQLVVLWYDHFPVRPLNSTDFKSMSSTRLEGDGRGATITRVPEFWTPRLAPAPITHAVFFFRYWDWRFQLTWLLTGTEGWELCAIDRLHVTLLVDEESIQAENRAGAQQQDDRKRSE